MFGSYACGRGAIGKFLCLARFTQALCLFIAGLRDSIQRVQGMPSGEKFRLDFAEANLRLLAGFAVCICHDGFPRKDACTKRAIKKGQATA
jgi:hypothetical protein